MGRSPGDVPPPADRNAVNSDYSLCPETMRAGDATVDHRNSDSPMFTTPRGLEIQLDVPTGFALLARLWARDPKTDAFRVLKTVEALEHIPTVAGFIGALIGLFWGSAAWQVAGGLIEGKILGKLLTMFGAFIFPGVVTLATWWSWVSGYGLLVGLGIASAWFLKGWEYGIAWIVGLVLGYVISVLFIETIQIKYYKDKIGVLIGQAEVNFINAYRLHADRLGLSHSIEIGDDEIQSGKWQDCLEDFAGKYPQAVARFMR